MAAKNKGGRPPNKLTQTFREFCRETITKPEVLEAIACRCLDDPLFALKVAEFGFGRPPQALNINAHHTQDADVIRTVHIGQAGLCGVETVPTSDLN